MKDIIECIQGFATPMNTLGMGDVNPSTDSISVPIKRNKRRKKKMKNLKDTIKAKLFESLNSDKMPSKQWKSEDLNEFLSSILTDSNDIKLFIGNYEDTIDEYSIDINDSEFEGIASIGGSRNRSKFEELDCDYDALNKAIEERGFDNVKESMVFWCNTGNGLRTIIFDLWLGNRSTLIIFGKDDMYRVIDELRSFKPEDCGQYLYM